MAKKQKEVAETPRKDDKRIKAFKKEMDKPIQNEKLALFYKVIKKKDVSNLEEDEIRALFYRALYLNDEERETFKSYLVLENMTEDEEIRYRRILPTHLFNKHFNYGY